MLEPLSTAFDTTGIKTGRPIIADGSIVKVRLADIGERSNDNGKSIVFEYHLLEPAPTNDGDQVKPGFSIREGITLYDKDTPPGEVPKRSLQKICARQDAFLGTGDEGNKKNRPTRPQFGPECAASMIGKEAFLKLKAKEGEFAGNDVISSIFPADLQP